MNEVVAAERINVLGFAIRVGVATGAVPATAVVQPLELRKSAKSDEAVSAHIHAIEFRLAEPGIDVIVEIAHVDRGDGSA